MLEYNHTFVPTGLFLIQIQNDIGMYMYYTFMLNSRFWLADRHLIKIKIIS